MTDDGLMGWFSAILIFFALMWLSSRVAQVAQAIEALAQ